jgi:hypothetical protein
MALTYTGTGGLFTRLGALVYMMDQVRTHQNNLKTLLANVQAEYSSSDAWMIDVLSGGIEGRIAEAGNVLNDVRAAAERTILEMCYAEAIASGATNTMVRKEIREALIWLIRQMDADTKTVDGTTITKSSLAVGASNNGNGKFYYYFEAPHILLGSTADWPNIRTEVLEARCVQDGVSGAISRGSEIFEIRGQPAYQGLDYRFPGGSGTLMRLVTCCASVDNGIPGQNILHNSDLEDQTSNLPDRFTVSSGTAGTEFLTETTAANVFRGSKSLKLAVTGSVFKIRQRLADFDGTLGRLTPDRPYLIAVAIKKDTTATGTLRISVQDSSGTIIGTSNEFFLSQSIAATTTSFLIYSATVRSPRVIPSEVYLVVETTSAIATDSVYIDEIIVAEMMPIAAGGPALAIVAGSTDWSADDNARYTFTNNNEGAFVRAFDRLFDMYGKGLSLPQDYSGTENIDDALIA